MGGCIGYHGTSQRDGGDFSFILLAGAVGTPEAIPRVQPSGGVTVDRARALVKWRR
jgi:hypothetical protein